MNTSPRARGGVGSRRQRAFTILELFIGIAVAAIVMAIAVPTYQSHLQKARVAAAIGDILAINLAITRYDLNYLALPADLAAIGYGSKLDPWGNPYAYLPFTGLKGKGQMRKDKNLVPINTRYDLYSAGADGQTKPPLTAKPSRDDVILANDGAYVGLASDY